MATCRTRSSDLSCTIAERDTSGRSPVQLTPVHDDNTQDATRLRIYSTCVFKPDSPLRRWQRAPKIRPKKLDPAAKAGALPLSAQTHARAPRISVRMASVSTSFEAEAAPGISVCKRGTRGRSGEDGSVLAFVPPHAAAAAVSAAPRRSAARWCCVARVPLTQKHEGLQAKQTAEWFFCGRARAER